MVQKYVNLTAHVDSWSYVVFGEQQFQQLPADLQQVILDCALEMQDFEHQAHVKEDQQIRNDLEQKGMEFIEVDREAFGAAAKEALFNSLSPEMQDIYNEIQELGYQ